MDFFLLKRIFLKYLDFFWIFWDFLGFFKDFFLDFLDFFRFFKCVISEILLDFLCGYFGFFSEVLRLLLNVTKVTTEQQKWPKVN